MQLKILHISEKHDKLEGLINFNVMSAKNIGLYSN